MKTGLVCLMMAAALAAAGDEVAELNARWGKGENVTFASDRRGDPVVTLRNAHGACAVALRGAKTVSWIPAGGEEVFFVPEAGIDCKVRKWQDWVHGGMPIVWPWFGSKGMPQEGWWARKTREWGWSDEPGPFIHGFARYQLFTVAAAGHDGARTWIKLSLRPSDETRKYLPRAFELDYTITLGADLGFELVTRNVDSEPFSIYEGYHPYFRVGNGFRTFVRGFDGFKYTSNRYLEYDLTHVWEGDLPIGPGCDIFDMKEMRSRTALVDPTMNRALALTTTGGRDVLTCFMPCSRWSDRDENLLNREVKSAVCLEPANYNRPVEVKPGESHVFAMKIELGPCSAMILK